MAGVPPPNPINVIQQGPVSYQYPMYLVDPTMQWWQNSHHFCALPFPFQPAQLAYPHALAQPEATTVEVAGTAMPELRRVQSERRVQSSCQ